VTRAPPCASTSAAISPAGPAPMMAIWDWELGIAASKANFLSAAVILIPA
jgi:hypothetical protein